MFSREFMLISRVTMYYIVSVGGVNIILAILYCSQSLPINNHYSRLVWCSWKLIAILCQKVESDCFHL